MPKEKKKAGKRANGDVKIIREFVDAPFKEVKEEIVEESADELESGFEDEEMDEKENIEELEEFQSSGEEFVPRPRRNGSGAVSSLSEINPSNQEISELEEVSASAPAGSGKEKTKLDDGTIIYEAKTKIDYSDEKYDNVRYEERGTTMFKQGDERNVQGIRMLREEEVLGSAAQQRQQRVDLAQWQRRSLGGGMGAEQGRGEERKIDDYVARARQREEEKGLPFQRKGKKRFM